MKRLYSILFALVAIMACSATVKAQGDNPFYVESVVVSSNDGVIITFSEDVKLVRHNMFSASETDKCLMILNAATSTTPMNVGKPTVKGNIVTCPKTYDTNLVTGDVVTITLQPQNFVSVNDNTLGGETVWKATVDAGKEVDPIKVILYSPTDGNRKSGTLNNITAEFSPSITNILDKSLVVLKNENGHQLALSTVSLDSENLNGALNVNVHEDARGEEGTTYSLHILPGAIECGGAANEKEIVFGKWFTTITPITLTIDPVGNTILEELSTVTVSCEEGEIELAGNASDITITGIMEYQVNTYATCTSIKKNADGSSTLTFDKTIKPGFENEVADIKTSQASKKDVKINIPAGTFKIGNRTNNKSQAIYTIQENIVLGKITWTFDPAAGSTVETLGVGSTVSDEDGTKTSYSINFTITEENNNLYVRIPDASSIKIYDEAGKAVKSFEKYDVFGGGNNKFQLDLSTNPLTAVGPSAKIGEVTLIIPADAIFYYTDANYSSNPIHPETDIEVTWTLAVVDGISTLKAEKTCNNVVYTISGAKVNAVQKGIVIKNNKKVLNK